MHSKENNEKIRVKYIENTYKKSIIIQTFICRTQWEIYKKDE